LLQTRGGRNRAHTRSVIFLFQQRKDAVAAFVNVELRVGLLKIHYSIEKIDVIELGPK
jgi:hypothetical protein